MIFYGIYDGDRVATQVEKAAFKDPGALDLYNYTPTAPLCFIRQFNCSDHARVINQPLILEAMAQQQSQMFRPGM